MSALRSKPRPLIDRDRQVIVLWSAKSACTSVYVWFANLCGFLDEVRALDTWPHTHREDVYRRSERYKKGVAAASPAFHVVKVIRDPHARAVSIFRHAVRNRLIKSDEITFCDFLLTLSRMNMAKANIHFRPQFHAYERERRPDTIINISKVDLFSELNALERRMDWPVTDFASMAWLRELESSRRSPKLTMEGTGYFVAPIVRSRRARQTPFPEDATFLAPEAKRLIEQIYAVDFEAYSADL